MLLTVLIWGVSSARPRTQTDSTSLLSESRSNLIPFDRFHRSMWIPVPKGSQPVTITASMRGAESVELAVSGNGCGSLSAQSAPVGP